jgi:pimeloyl-ACP methyl ester carboxylesterase
MPEHLIDETNLHYEIVGEGPPLLLIAGLASDGASWGPLPAELPGRQLIVVDNRGSGQTRSAGPIQFADLVADVAKLLEALAVGPVDVVGHSLGGAIGLSLAAQHPHLVKRLVTLTSGGLTPSKTVLLNDMARLGFIVPTEDWFRLLYQWLFSDAFFADEANVAAAAAASAAYSHRQSPGDFARQVAALTTVGPLARERIACPVLAVSAERDLLAPPAAVDALHAGIAGLTRLEVPGVAHSIHWEAPEAVGALIREFLEAADV